MQHEIAQKHAHIYTFRFISHISGITINEAAVFQKFGK